MEDDAHKCPTMDDQGAVKGKVWGKTMSFGQRPSIIKRVICR